MDCQNCEAPLAENCQCESCHGAGLQTYCHACRVLYRTIYTNEYFSALSKSEETARIARLNRMGL